MKLIGKRVLITGGAKRCGAAIVRRFAAEGAVIALHCNTSIREAEELLAAIPGQEHQLFQADFSIPGEAEKLAGTVGAFDMLVNNASIFFRPGSPEDLSAGNLYRQVNYLAPKILLEYFFAQNLSGGCAVNILDQAVFNPGQGGYWQSKKDLAELTSQLVLPWAERNLRINAVAPGPMIPPPWAPASRMEKTLPLIPLHRPVSPADFADTVAFLCTNDSATGVTIPLDCGLLLFTGKEVKQEKRDVAPSRCSGLIG